MGRGRGNCVKAAGDERLVHEMKVSVRVDLPFRGGRLLNGGFFNPGLQSLGPLKARLDPDAKVVLRPRKR